MSECDCCHRTCPSECIATGEHYCGDVSACCRCRGVNPEDCDGCADLTAPLQASVTLASGGVRAFPRAANGGGR